MKTFIFSDEAGQVTEGSLRAQRLRRIQNDVLWGAWPPPTECDFEGTHSEISAMGPEFPATALRAITVSGPFTVYHLVFTPYSSFLTVTDWRVFFHMEVEGFSIGSSQTSPSSPGHRWCLQWPISGLYSPYQNIFSKILANENIHYDVDENLWPNPQDRLDKNLEEQWGLF